MKWWVTVGGLVVAACAGALLALAVQLPPIPDQVAAWLTPIVGAAAVLQALFAYWALRGLRHSREAAEAATAGLALTRETTERQLRAYVSYAEARHERLEVGKIFAVEVEFENCGDTPAYDVRCCAKPVMLDSGTTYEYPCPPDEVFETASKTTLGPGRTTTIHAWTEEPISAEQITLIENEVLTISVHGELKYRDTFGTERNTAFRVVYKPAPVQDGRMWLCADGNSAT